MKSRKKLYIRVIRSRPAEESVGNESTEQTKHESGAEEVGDSVGGGSIVQMHGPRQVSHQIYGNTQRCQPLNSLNT